MFNQIREHISNGHSDRQVAAKLKINRKTVSKYRRSNSPPRYRSRDKSTRVDPLAQFEQAAKHALEKVPDLTGSDLFLHLKELGYAGSERTVQRRLSAGKFGMPKPQERFFEQEYSPGEQCQFDFKERIPIMFKTGERICHFHVSILPFSGIFFIRIYPNRAYESFMDGGHNFFEFIEGRTKNIRIDNLSPCVAQVLKGNKRKYTQSFARATEYYGFGVLPCEPLKGNQKGSVERSIRTHYHRIRKLLKLQEKVFLDFNEANEWLLAYCIKYQTPKSRELFQIEKAHLSPVPQYSESIVCKEVTARVSKHGTARVENLKASYSVPDEYIGKFVRVVTSAYSVSIYEKQFPGELICTHPRLEHCKSSVLIGHVIKSLVRKPAAMIRWAHREILFEDVRLKKLYNFLQKHHEEAAEREFLKIVNLVLHVDLAQISLAAEVIIEQKPENPFEAAKNLLLCGPSQSLTPSYAQRPLNPDLSSYDDLMGPSVYKEEAS